MRRAYPVKHIGAHRYTIAGSFRPAGTGAPTDVKGHGFSVVRSDVGKFTITFGDAQITDLDAVAAMPRGASLANGLTVFGGDWNLANRTLVLQVMAENGAGLSAPVDLAADADNVINFVAYVRSSSVDV